MNKKKFTLALVWGLLYATTICASTPSDDTGELDINTIIYIEEEEVIDLGFDTADYLPEDFDPYEVYFDVDSVIYVEVEDIMSRRKQRRLAKRLPEGFDAYANPTSAESFNYIDSDDTIELNFDTTKHLPEGFDAYIRS